MSGARGPLALALVLAAAAGCKQPAIRAGDECTRSSECSAGLVCVEGVCSDDLGPLADQGTVPMLMPEMMEGEENADAAAPMMATDAGP